jgi:tetrahydromethanopterin S-methyltransferase subunit D
MISLSKTQWTFFIASFIAFIVLNTIENILHYNIGRTSNQDQVVVFKNPTYKDWIRIIIIMTVFAILQSCLTLFIQHYE